jgi:hypothetical protein
LTTTCAGCLHERSATLRRAPQTEDGFYSVHEGENCANAGRLRARGNGFVIGVNLVMTAAHMLPDDASDTAQALNACLAPKLALRRGSICIDAEIVAVDVKRDVMILTAPLPDLAFSLAIESPETLDPVAKLGFVYEGGPGYRFIRQPSRVITTHSRLCPGGNRPDADFKILGIFPRGTSGSAVFDADGNVAGMLIRADQGAAKPYAVIVDVATLRDVLESAYECKVAPCAVNPCP